MVRRTTSLQLFFFWVMDGTGFLFALIPDRLGELQVLGFPANRTGVILV